MIAPGMVPTVLIIGFFSLASPGSVTVGDIAHLLWRLRMLGEIRLVEKGCGRKPHMYLKF